MNFRERRQLKEEKYSEMLENTKNNPLSEHEIEAYANTFRNHLSAVMFPYPFVPRRTATFRSKMKKTHLIMLIIISMLLVFLFAYMTIRYNLIVSSSDFDVVYKIAAILVGALVLTGIGCMWRFTFEGVKNVLIEIKNLRKLKVGDICLYDPNGYTKIKADENLYAVQILSIKGQRSIVCCDMNNNHLFECHDARLLIPLDREHNHDHFMVRYPVTLPKFYDEDIAAIESALVLAHENDNELLYHLLCEHLSKVRAFAQNPFGKVDDDDRSVAEQYADIEDENINEELDGQI